MRINFLGIRNLDLNNRIHIVIETEAITLDEQWGIRDVIQFDVSPRDVAYLKN